MPPRKGHGRAHRVPMDEEAASAPLPQGDPQVPLELPIPPIAQARFFPPMTFEAFQAFTNYWYTQVQAQAQA